MPSSGRGVVYSFTVVHRAPDPSFKDDVPYVIAIVELDEGVRLMSNMVSCSPEAVHIDMPVEALFETVSEGVGVAKFRPA